MKQAFVKINDGYTIDLDEPEGFVKVGHVIGVIRKKTSNGNKQGEE